MHAKLFMLVVLLGASPGSFGAADAPLQVVASVDIARYAGRWYEIARLPNRFQEQCVADVTATYRLRDDGRLDVVNECRLAGGDLERAAGVARRAAAGGPDAKLEVRFAPAWLGWLPFVWGDYWIVDLAGDYGYALVGTPDRKYLWILARRPQLDDATYARIVQLAAAQGFDVARLQRTRHAP
jgi:apolipoprotein D and lipocalin family protein